MKPLLLDAFRKQGGASHGYALAGFEVVGVDIDPQPRYPYEFVQGDAIEFVRDHGHKFAVRAGSPPCRAHTLAQRIRGNDHDDLIGAFRGACLEVGGPYVIENVEGAPLVDPVLLCGAMFGLRTYRHRLFESNVPLATRLHPRHIAPMAKMGRPIRDGEFYQAVGNFAGAELVRADMGVPWMTRDGIRDTIPPPYTKLIGEQLMAHLGSEVAA